MTSTALLIDALHRAGLRNLHGFELARAGLRMFGADLLSADSTGWSRGERYTRVRCPENSGRRDCGNCLHRAEEWGREIQAELDGPTP